MTVTTPTQGTVCNLSAKTSYVEPVYKISSSISHSGDILGGNKKLNGSRDHNPAPFRDNMQLRFSSVSNFKHLRSFTTKI